MKRVTIICPETALSDLRHLLMALASGPTEDAVPQFSAWERATTGQPMGVASTELPESWLEKIQTALTRPEWDTDAIIDMPAAERARAALDISDGITGEASPSESAIIVVHGLAALDALAFAGVVQAASDR